MDIVYASDNNFAEMLGISMISLFENNKTCDEINIYILDDKINDDNKKKLKYIADEYERSVCFLDVQDLLNSDMKQQRGSLSTFSRLYLAKIMPDGIDKILYLDCDMLILSNIDELYNIDLNGYYCAGVNDCLSDSHLKLIGLKSGDNYFNAGVLLINLKLWKEENISDKFEKFSELFNGNVPYADQGIINGVLSCNSKKTALRFNCYTALYDFTYNELLTFRRPSEYYTDAEVESAKKDPSIVHFTTSFLSLRPWIEGCKHPYVKEWLRYKSMSPWAEAPLRKDNRSGKKRFAVKVYKLLPKKLSIKIVGLLHSKIVPMTKNRINKK